MAEQLMNSLDNPTSTLAAGISDAAVSLTVATGEGSRFPASGTFRVTLTDQNDDSLYEVVEVGAISGDVLSSLTRAAESANGGGSAKAFVAGDHVDLVLSAEALANYVSENAGSTDLTDAVILAPAASARNVIVPTAGTVIAAVVQAHAGQSVDVMQWKNSAATMISSVNYDGSWSFEGTTDFNPVMTLNSVGATGTLLIAGLQNGNDAFYINADGQMQIIGNVSNAIQLILQPLNPGHATDVMRVQVGATFPFRLDKNGRPVIAVHSAPSAGTANAGLIAAGDLAQWFDQTNGAAKWMGWGRTADGTTVTWEIPNGVVYVAGGTDVALADGGTGSSTASGARTNLGAAPLDATYITQTANSELSGEQALGALATGILKSTTTTGVLSIAGATDYVSPNLFDANTVLAADSDNTPAAVTMAASTILARLASGNIKAATVAEINTLLNLQIDTIGAGTDITTNNVSITQHGLTPKLPNDATKYLDGTGAYTSPPGTGGSGAPSTATYITQTADAGLSAEQALSSLSTGLTKVTTGTGVLSTATEGTDYYKPGGTDVAVADGGTGSSTAAAARTALDVPASNQRWPYGGTTYKTAHYYVHDTIGVVSSLNSALTQSLVTCVPFVCRATTTFDRIAVFQNSAGTATTVHRMGIYNDNGASYPGTVLLDAGTVAGDTGTSVVKEITISQQLTPGLYWLAHVNQTAAGASTLNTSTGSIVPFWMSLPSVSLNGACYTQSSVTGALGTFTSTVTIAATGAFMYLRAA